MLRFLTDDAWGAGGAFIALAVGVALTVVLERVAVFLFLGEL